MSFSYPEFVGRNIGFVTEEEQQKIRSAKVFIAGVGGMGGSALLNLVRAGVGEVWIADFDTFEVSNLNRQLFANLDYVGRGKVEATVDQLRKINPELKVRTFDENWVNHLDEILKEMTIVINGCDDGKATIHLMRKAKDFGKTVIDAFAAPLPSVYVVRPTDPRPEELFRYPSRGKRIDELTPEILAGCFQKEILYVLLNSSSSDFVVPRVAKDVLEGKRKRFSFAPMVICTGTLMAFEALRFILGKEGKDLHKGYFFNPWKVRVERPCVWLLPYRVISMLLFFRKVKAA